MGSMKHMLSAYVDKVLFHVSDPLVSLPNLMEELFAYSKVSSFRINHAKSDIFPVTIPPALTTTLKGFSFCLGTPLYALPGRSTYYSHGDLV